MITAMPRIAIASRDFDGMLAFFRDKLGLPVVDISASSVDSLGAKLAMCVPDGGSNIELMCPAVETAPLAESLSRFLDRRGEGLFALMLEAPDPDAEAALLRQRGLHVLPVMPGAGGRDVHPRATHGVLIRVYPDNSFEPAEDSVELDPGKSLGLSGIVRVVIAVKDLAAAADTYGRQLGLDVGQPDRDENRGVASVLCRPPRGGVIELVSVADAGKPFARNVASHLAARGEGMFALVLTADDQDIGARLSARGVATEPSGCPGACAVSAESCFGTRLLIERGD